MGNNHGFELTCPKCGAPAHKALLEVVTGTFHCRRMYLEADGFSFVDAKQVSTEDEVVRCRACEKTFPLEDCLEG